MRLFLSSQNLGNYPKEFARLMGDNKKLAFTENAKDDWSPNDRAAKVLEHKEQFEALGFEFVDLDLRDFFNKPAELENLLNGCGGLWVSGGNTFILRRAMVLSGLDTIIKKLVGEDRLAYGGSSAGSIVVTPSLRGTELGDEPDTIPEGYINEVIWDGLNLVPYYIVPHYKSDWFGDKAQAMKDYFEKEKLPYYVLSDGQVIVVEGSEEKILK